MCTNGFARRSASVVALLVFGLILAYSLPGTAETGIDSSPIEFSDAALEDVFVRIEDDVSIEPDLKTITIPKSVRVIEDSFNGCTALKTVRGTQGSYAQTCAEEHGYTFVALDD